MKTFVVIGATLAVLGALVLLNPSHACRRHRPFTTISFTRTPCGWRVYNTTGSLKTIASAQADFRGNDRDGNKIQDFWRGDISGLYAIVPAGSTDMIKLIELSVAAADAAPSGGLELGAEGPGQIALDRYTVPSPKVGYYFRALRHADEDPSALDSHSRFAACAYPADYGLTGEWTFIIDEGNTIFKRDLGRQGPPDVFPDEATLLRDWEKVDG